MTSFNVSEWALKHRSFIWFLMLVSCIAGVLAYRGLGREEDPKFTIKTMIVQQRWPGATVHEMIDQVTERIEKELKQIDALDYTKSYTTPGQTTVFVNLKDTTNAKDVPWLFYQVRKHVEDIQYEMPSGVKQPAFNDEFGDVYGNIYGFTADGFTQRQLRDYVEQVRSEVLSVPSIGKVQVIGAQDEVIYLDISIRKLAALGLDVQSLIDTLKNQNAVQPSGVVQAGPEQVSLRVSGQFASEDSLRAVNLRVNDRFFRLTDVATISRGYKDPPDPLFRIDGQPAIGLGIAMTESGNLLQFGEALKAKMREIEGTLPVGVGVHLVSDQPKVVEEAVNGFVKALIEAVVIVLAVSFLSLGVRAGLVVSFSIPLVLAVTFVVMEIAGISLQRISLGALIIALGLLVDDAMITVEMMVSRLEAGEKLENAATYAFKHTALPMLTGTLVTVSGFIPIGFNSSSAGEYTHSLFVVIAASLLVSWVVAVLFAPLLGVKILPKTMKHHSGEPGRLMRMFSAVLLGAMRWRWATILFSFAMLAVSIYGTRFVQQQFFPSSDRVELLVDMTLPQNASVGETKAQMDRFEQKLAGQDDIESWSSYVSQGAIRFYLPLDQQLANDFFGQMVIVTKSIEARERVQARLRQVAQDSFAGVDVFVHSLDLGPPVGRPVQYRISGPDTEGVRAQAFKVAKLLGDSPHLTPPTLDWNEPGKVVRVEINQDKARQLGINSSDVANILNGVVGGSSITQVPRRHLPRRGRGSGGRGRAQQRRDLGESPAFHQQRGRRPPARLRDPAVRPRTADRLAAQSPADHHAAVEHARHHAAGHGGPATRAQHRATPARPSDRLHADDGRHGRGERKGPGPDRGRRARHAARDGVFHHGPAAELLQDDPRRQRGAAGPDRSRRSHVDVRQAARIRGHPGRPRPDRDHHPELDHPDDADRRGLGGRQGPLDRGTRSHHAPRPPHPADRRGSEPRHDPDRPRDLLGAHGLCDDRRHPRGDAADAAVPAGALRRLVPREGAAARHAAGREGSRTQRDGRLVEGRGIEASRRGVMGRSMHRVARAARRPAP